MVKVLIVAEIRLYREGLFEILGKAGGLQVIGAAGSCEEAIACMQENRSDVVLFDMTMSESLSAINAIRQIDTGITVVAFALREVENEVLACVEAGVSGWVPPEAPLEVLVDTVLKAVRGELVCSPSIAGALVRQVRSLTSTPTPDPEFFELTPRQQEIADLIEQGYSNKQIAQKLCIGLATVKVHVHNILDRLQVHRRGQAAAILRPCLARKRQGLIQRV